MVHTLFAEGLARSRRDWREHLNGMEELRAAAEPFTPEAVAPRCRHRRRRRSAGWRASWPPPSARAVYGRIGTCTQEFGTLASWLVDVLNALTGNLDRAGGAMFPKAAAGARNTSGDAGARARHPLRAEA